MNFLVRKLRDSQTKRMIRYEKVKLNKSSEEAESIVKDMLRDYFSESPRENYDEKELEMLEKRRKLRESLKQMRKKRKNMIRNFLYYRWLPFVFWLFSHKPVDEKLVLFADHEFTYLPDNMRGLYNRFQKHGYKTVVFLKPKMSKFSLLKWIYRVSKATEFTRYYARSSFVFLTEYYFPVYANKPREGTQVVQLWHACGAFKRWGYSTADSAWGGSRESLELCPIHNTYTSVMISSPKVVPFYAEAFHCSDVIILPMGTPRTDIYFNKKFVSGSRKTLLEKFPEIGNRKIILYAPTFRGNSLTKSFSKNMMDYGLMKRLLGKDYVLINKLHPLVANGFRLNSEERELYGDFVFDISKTVPIEKALCAADIVISDYSSLIFEYAILERPLVFFAYDLEEYDRARSFYFDYKDFVPGPIVTDTMQIIDAVKKMETDFDIEKVRRFKRDYMSACDGHSTDRIFEYVLSHQKKCPE